MPTYLTHICHLSVTYPNSVPQGLRCIGFCHFFEAFFEFADAEVGNTGKAFTIEGSAGENSIDPEVYSDCLKDYLRKILFQSTII